MLKFKQSSNDYGGLYSVVLLLITLIIAKFYLEYDLLVFYISSLSSAPFHEEERKLLSLIQFILPLSITLVQKL